MDFNNSKFETRTTLGSFINGGDWTVLSRFNSTGWNCSGWNDACNSCNKSHLFIELNWIVLVLKLMVGLAAESQLIPRMTSWFNSSTMRSNLTDRPWMLISTSLTTRLVVSSCPFANLMRLTLTFFVLKWLTCTYFSLMNEDEAPLSMRKFAAY